MLNPTLPSDGGTPDDDTDDTAATGQVMVADVIKSMTINGTHGVLTDDAFSAIKLNGTKLAAKDFDADEGTFTSKVAVAALVDDAVGSKASVKNHMIDVELDGRTPISSWSAGSLTLSFEDATATDSITSIADVTGDLASLTRGGLNTQLNMAQSTYGDGATRYQSWVRIHNNGITDGSVRVTIHDAETGETLGYWHSAVIPAGGAIQVSAGDLENHLGVTPSGPAQYNLTIDGDINGYVQHVMWNAVDGLFSDLSGFRAGGGLNTTP